MTDASSALARIRAAVRADLRQLVADDGSGPAVHGPAGPVPIVLVACSGGADSTSLAAAVAAQAPAAGLRAGAVTVDHGLQPGSDRRAAEVVAMLERLGLDPVVAVPSRPDPSTDRAAGPEGAARAARYRALAAARDATDAVAVLLGHTLDDQAETVLLGLARGSGARSLGGMRPVAGAYRRPLLGLRRADTRAACAAAGLPVWDDPHNTDPRHRRVRVRDRVLPVLEAELGPGMVEALVRTASMLAADADALDALSGPAWASAAVPVTEPVTESSGVSVTGAGGLRAAALAELPAALATRVIRRWLLEAGAPSTDLTHGHVHDVLRLATHWHGQGPLTLPGRLQVERVAGVLQLRR